MSGQSSSLSYSKYFFSVRLQVFSISYILFLSFCYFNSLSLFSFSFSSTSNLPFLILILLRLHIPEQESNPRSLPNDSSMQIDLSPLSLSVLTRYCTILVFITREVFFLITQVINQLPFCLYNLLPFLFILSILVPLSFFLCTFE